jgi:hypothetical protein
LLMRRLKTQMLNIPTSVRREAWAKARCSDHSETPVAAAISRTDSRWGMASSAAAMAVPTI